MTDQPYTPTPDDLELFKKIAQLRYSNEQLRPEERQRAFDHFEHMLNAIESTAEQRGAEHHLRLAASELNMHHLTEDLSDDALELGVRFINLIQDRADRIANKEGDIA